MASGIRGRPVDPREGRNDGQRGESRLADGTLGGTAPFLTLQPASIQPTAGLRRPIRPLILAIQRTARDIFAVRKFLLASGGFDLLTSSTFQKGQALLEKHLVDVILVDLVLPDGSGLAFVDEAQASGFEGGSIITMVDRSPAATEEAARRDLVYVAVKTASWPAPLPDLLHRVLDELRQRPESAESRAVGDSRDPRSTPAATPVERPTASEIGPPLPGDSRNQSAAIDDLARLPRSAPRTIELAQSEYVRLRHRYGEAEVDYWLREIATRLTSSLWQARRARRPDAQNILIFPYDLGAVGSQEITRVARRVVANLKAEQRLPSDLLLHLQVHEPASDLDQGGTEQTPLTPRPAARTSLFRAS